MRRRTHLSLRIWCDGFVRDDAVGVSPVERRRDVTGHLETPDRRGAGCREMIGKIVLEKNVLDWN